jgi:subtilisin family serine protease
MKKLAVGGVVAVAVAVLAAASDAHSRPASAARSAQPGAAVVAPALARRLAAAGPNDAIDLLVVLKRQASLPSLPTAARAKRLSAVENALRATATATQAPLLQFLAGRRAAGRVVRVTPLWIFNGVIVRAKPDVVRQLSRRSDVLALQPRRDLEASRSLADDGSSAPEPNVELVNAPALWNLGYRGQGAVVASMDTGVDVSHPDLAAAWRGGGDSWYDPSGQHSTPVDVNGHGTKTTGVMVGGSGGGTALGIAPAAKWIAVKIFNDQGVATTTGIHQGFQWLLDPDANPTTDDAPDVVDNSWTMGVTGCDLEFQLDLRALRAAGIVAVFAAGNAGPSPGSDFSPANNPEALAVGNTDGSDAVDPRSSRGPSSCDGGTFPDVTAPGVGVKTTDLYGLYARESGTSMSAPHVAGALALLRSAFPDASADRQETAIEAGAADLGAPGPDNDTGYGRLDGLEAYNWLATSPDFAIAASPASVTVAQAGTASYSVDVTSLNGFSDAVSLSVSGLPVSGATWAVTPSTISGGSGTARLDVNTTAELAPGTYELTVIAASGSQTHRSTVSLEVSGSPDFTIAASPASTTIAAGATGTYTVNVGSRWGFADDVSLSLSGLTTSQASWTFSPGSVAGSGTAALTVSTATSLAAGTYALTITGASGSLVHTTHVSLVVTPPPSFTISASPGSAATPAGGKASYVVTVRSQYGFAGAVALSLSGLSSSQASWSFSPSTVVGAGTSTLTVTTSSSLVPGVYPVKISGTSGSLVRSTNVSLIVPQPPDFSLSLSPTSAAVTAGGSASFSVNVGSKAGFNGTATLTVSGLPSGATATFSVNPVPAASSSVLTVRTAVFGGRGTFSLRVTGTSGSLVHSATATLTVR